MKFTVFCGWPFLLIVYGALKMRLVVSRGQFPIYDLYGAHRKDTRFYIEDDVYSICMADRV